MQVRIRPPLLTATKVTTARPVELPDGTRLDPCPVGWWLIARGQSQVIAAVSPAQLTASYDLVREGDCTIPVEICQRIEQTTGIGSTRSGELLAAAVERLATIAIGDVRIAFTPGQLDEIKHRAIKRGHTVAQEIQAAVDRVASAIFHNQ